jgi:hypothetical protein
MQGLGEGSDPAGDGLGHGHEVHDAVGGINDRRIGDTDLGCDLGAIPHIRLGHGHGDAANKTVVPIGYSSGVGVEGVGAVVFGDHVNHVMGPATDGDVGHVEGLGIDLPVHRVGKKFPKISAVDVGGRKNGFVLVPTVAGLVVMVGRQGSLGV